PKHRTACHQQRERSDRLVHTQLRPAFRKADETVEGAATQNRRLQGPVPTAGGDVPELAAASLDPPSRAVVDVSAADGSESSRDLRRKLRLCGGSQGRAAE